MPAFDVVGTAQRWYDRALDEGGSVNTEKLEAMEALLEAADLAMMSGTGIGDIISGNKNGASYTMRVDAVLSQRVDALSKAINGLKNEIRPSRYARGYFRQP